MCGSGGIVEVHGGFTAVDMQQWLQVIDGVSWKMMERFTVVTGINDCAGGHYALRHFLMPAQLVISGAARANDLRSAPHHTAAAEETVMALPTFEEMRHRARRLLSQAYDELHSDWAPGTGPTAEQAEAAREARELIHQARAALDRAAD